VPWQPGNDVVIGEGKLAGKGVYAARHFKKGDLVVPYNLKELTQAEFDALPAGEWEWTHSFWGRIHLFPEPGYEGRGTNVLRRINGSWRIVHEHLSA
jgi:SnoaL-like domain